MFPWFKSPMTRQGLVRILASLPVTSFLHPVPSLPSLRGTLSPLVLRFTLPLFLHARVRTLTVPLHGCTGVYGARNSPPLSKLLATLAPHGQETPSLLQPVLLHDLDTP